MYARRLALCCLLYVSTAFGRPETGAGKDVVVYLKSGVSPSAAALAEMKVELASLMRGMGVQIYWWNPASQPEAVGAGASLIVADFLGTCSTPSRANQAVFTSSLPPLAETSIADDHILPFAHVNCDALSQFLASLVANQPGARRDFMYGRAIARLLAHEVYHIVAQTRDHAAAGIAKEQFSPANLLSERFEFEPAAVAKGHKPPRLPVDLAIASAR